MKFGEEKYSGYDIAIIETNLSCQLDCPGCYMHQEMDGDDTQLHLDQAVEILDRSRDYKGSEISEVQLVGGEPLLWDHLRKFIELAKERGINIQIYTNMIATSYRVSRFLFKNEVKITGKLNISPDGDEEQLKMQADMIGRPIDTARKMIERIHILISAGYDQSLLRLNNVLRKDNLKYVLGFYRWCLENKIGADFELMSSGGEIDETYWELSPEPQQIAELIRGLQQVRSDLGLPEAAIAMPHIFNACMYCRHHLYFALNGDIKACSTSGLPILANMSDPDAIKKARESEVMIARQNLNQALVGEPCDTCDCWDGCQGGCRATAESSGDNDAGYGLCAKPYL